MGDTTRTEAFSDGVMAVAGGSNARTAALPLHFAIALYYCFEQLRSSTGRVDTPC